jgi:hypothetical protein
MGLKMNKTIKSDPYGEIALTMNHLKRVLLIPSRKLSTKTVTM